MPLLLFLPAAPLLRQRPRPSLTAPCRAPPRPRRVPHACIPQPPDSEPGDPEWMQLARELAPDSEAVQKPASKPPKRHKWNYPQGKLDEFDGDGENPWAVWNDAQSRSGEPFAQRDPKAETDFWRGAARDIAEEAPIADEQLSQPTTSSDVWRMAREVTGEMVDLQSKLRDELEDYDSVQNVDGYRDIARDLVGPPPEVGDDARPIRESADLDKGAEAGQGWNPDVDWMRFDDVQRELRKKNDKNMRQEAEKAARESWRQQRSFNEQPSEERVWETGTYTDQSTAPHFLESNSMPRFMRNRYMQSGTYGAGWNGAKSEMEQLTKEGVPLRDPKADADQWRSVARELDLDVEDDIIAANEQRGAEDTTSDINVTVERTDSDPEIRSVAATDGQGGGETASWESWRSGTASWESANEKIQERDPKKEVDMWRSSARELTTGATSGVDQSGETASWESWRSGNSTWESANQEPQERDPKKEVDMWRSNAQQLSPSSPSSTAGYDSSSRDLSSSGDAESQPSVWDSWRNANDRWMQSLNDEDEWSQGPNDLSSLSETPSDWGARMGKKTSSERSAWQAWESASRREDTTTWQEWWKLRTDAAHQSGPKKSSASLNDIDQWRDVAQQVASGGGRQPDAPSESIKGSKKARLADDSAINSWKSVARDLAIETSSEEEE
ncbi:hypothetical protein FGB62_31g14 [Gracilaria domingensis]|nr:hypothetical protein FGB62_31g14 [Gracilaria domingensis]